MWAKTQREMPKIQIGRVRSKVGLRVALEGFLYLRASLKLAAFWDLVVEALPHQRQYFAFHS